MGGKQQLGGWDAAAGWHLGVKQLDGQQLSCEAAISLTVELRDQ